MAVIATAGRRSPGSRRSTSGGSTTTSIWPLTFLSIHPDYLLVHRLEPARARSHPGRLPVAVRAVDDRGRPTSTRRMPIAFWDLTNRQDWHVCELQQRGTRSQSWTAGRYSNQEPSVHAFDLMAVDRYANDGVQLAADRPIALRRTAADRGATPSRAGCRGSAAAGTPAADPDRRADQGARPGCRGPRVGGGAPSLRGAPAAASALRPPPRPRPAGRARRSNAPARQAMRIATR